MADPQLDAWQYRIGRTEVSGARQLGDRWLEVGEGLPCVAVTDRDGRPAGVILGFAIDIPARRMLAEMWRAPFALGAEPDAFVIDSQRVLGGQFLWILPVDGRVLVYPNCSAQVPCVYDTETGRAGSTAHALFDDATYERRFDRALYDHLGVDGEGWFPAGLTAHKGLERLLPGHCLDLDAGSFRRFWPLAEVRQAADPDAVVTEMIALIRGQMEAVIASPLRLGQALTGGHETRMLLSCARPYIGGIDVVTVVGEDRHTMDTTLARRIVRDMGLTHIELPRLNGTDAQRDLFIRRGGHCNGDTNARFHPSVWPIAHSHYFVGGLGGEVGRAFLWRPSDTPETPITAEVLMARFGLPPTPVIAERLAAWLRGLPPMSAYGILDLAYLEHRMGPWYAVQFCSDPTLVRLAPIFTWRGTELMLSLPPDWKRESRLGHEIIRRQWPELLAYPFNSLGRFRDTMIKIQKVAKSPRLIMKKLRKLRH